MPNSVKVCNSIEPLLPRGTSRKEGDYREVQGQHGSRALQVSLSTLLAVCYWTHSLYSRYFVQSPASDRFCPFGKDCFYQHLNDDGTPFIFDLGVEYYMRVSGLTDIELKAVR